MPALAWNNWYRSDGCTKWMNRTRFAGVPFTDIFYQGMRMVFADEKGAPGMLYRGDVYNASKAVVIANGRFNGFGQADWQRMLLRGDFKYNDGIFSPRLRFEGPDSDDVGADKVGQMAEAPVGGSEIDVQFYNLVAAAISGTTSFIPVPLPQNADGVRQLALLTGAVVLHEIMHNHGFSHPSVATWKPGSDYASTLPHVAFRSALDAGKAQLGSTSLGISSATCVACATNDGTQGKPAPTPPPPPPAPPKTYNAVFEKGAGRYMMRGWAQADLMKEVEKKRAESYRLIDQIRYEDVPGQPRYDAVFAPAAGQHKVVWDYDLGSLKAFEANLAAKGLKLLHQLSYPTAQGRRYDAIFAEMPGEQRVLWGWTRQDMEVEEKKLEQQGFYLHHQTSYDLAPQPGGRRYDAIFLQVTPDQAAGTNKGRSLILRGLPRNTLEERIGAAAVFAGLSLHQLDGWRGFLGVPFYDAIFRPGARDFALGLTAEELTAFESKEWAKGYRTLQVDRIA